MHFTGIYYPYNLDKVEICKYQTAFDDNSIDFKSWHALQTKKTQLKEIFNCDNIRTHLEILDLTAFEFKFAYTYAHLYISINANLNRRCSVEICK